MAGPFGKRVTGLDLERVVAQAAACHNGCDYWDQRRVGARVPLAQGVLSTKIAMHDIPSKRKLNSSKWVFKCKSNGMHRACALGYSQVTGLDYTDNFAPLVNFITVRLVLLC